MTISRADLASAVLASRVLPHPVIKLGHSDPRFGGEPSLGTVRNLRLDNDGTTLVGDLHNVPAWLADNMTSAYPQRSIEAIGNYSSDTHQFRFAMTALALLGADWPAVTSLDTLQDLLEKEA